MNLPDSLTDHALRAALLEVRDAGSQPALGADGVTAGADAPALPEQAVSDARVQQMRERARQQRERGARQLGNRHVGIASLLLRIELRERVIGSAFERWFAPIEMGLYVLKKQGPYFLGTAASERLLAKAEADIGALEATLKQELALLALRQEACAAPGTLVPTYTTPSAVHEVQLRTLQAKRVLDVIRQLDELQVGLVQLLWNGEIEEAQVIEAENRAKRAVRELASFLGRAVRGMRERAGTPPAPEAPATAA